jgi:hypothetical protein
MYVFSLILLLFSFTNFTLFLHRWEEKATMGEPPAETGQTPAQPRWVPRECGEAASQDGGGKWGNNNNTWGVPMTMMTMMGPAVPGDGEIPPVMRGHHQQGQDQ